MKERKMMRKKGINNGEGGEVYEEGGGKKVVIGMRDREERRMGRMNEVVKKSENDSKREENEVNRDKKCITAQRSITTQEKITPSSASLYPTPLPTQRTNRRPSKRSNLNVSSTFLRSP